MTEREAINVLLHHKEAFEISGKTADAIDLAISALKKQEADRWIPVTKRPPEKEGCYLVTIKYDHERRYSKTAWYSGDGWITRQDIIAWRFTPEPYTEEEDE